MYRVPGGGLIPLCLVGQVRTQGVYKRGIILEKVNIGDISIIRVFNIHYFRGPHG